MQIARRISSRRMIAYTVVFQGRQAAVLPGRNRKLKRGRHHRAAAIENRRDLARRRLRHRPPQPCACRGALVGGARARAALPGSDNEGQPVHGGHPHDVRPGPVARRRQGGLRIMEARRHPLGIRLSGRRRIGGPAGGRAVGPVARAGPSTAALERLHGPAACPRPVCLAGLRRPARATRFRHRPGRLLRQAAAEAISP